MMINTDVKILQITGEPVKDDKGNSATVKSVILDALSTPIQNEMGDVKFRKYGISKKIFDNEPVDLSAEEISLIKELIGKFYAPQVVGFIWNYLEGKDIPQPKLKLAEVQIADAEKKR